MWLLNIFISMFDWFVSFFISNDKDYTVFGELIVVGNDELHIKIKKGYTDASVEFKDNLNCVPCDVPCRQSTAEKLEWFITCHKTHDNLVIKWDVASSRLILWQVNYK